MNDVLIIGGGLIGLLTARELASAGARVTLVERGETGRESSWAGGGIISPLYPWRVPGALSALAGWSQAVYPELAASLFEETGIDPELIVSGMLVFDTRDFDEATAWSMACGQPLERRSGQRLHALEPQLSPQLSEALLLPGIAQVRNPRLVKAVRASIASKILLRENEEVSEILVDRERVIGVRTPQGPIEAGRVVVCAGAWSRRLLESVGGKADIEPVRGQMILFHARPGQIHHISLYQDRYLIPRSDGRLLFGSTLEPSDFVKTTTAEAKEALYRAAFEMFPVLKRTPIEHHWAGLRPGSPHGIPYIGPLPGIEGLFINAGHFRNGIVTGPSSARLAADLILARTPILDPAPYAIDAPRP